MADERFNARGSLFVLALGLVALLTLTACSDNTPDAMASSPVHMATTTFGCQSKATAERIAQLDGENDREAAVQFVAENISTGECASFNVGTAVFVEAKTLTGLTQIRPQGMPTSYWTVSEAVGH